MTDLFGTSLTAESLPTSLYPVLLVVGVGGIAGLIYFILRRRALTTLYLKDPLFDGPARSFYGLLDVAVREHFSLFRDVSIGDVIRHSGTVSPLPDKLRKDGFDLLLCDRRKMLPRCGIVLVEKHNPRVKETEVLRTFCDKVGLPLLVYQIGGFFDVVRLRNDIYQATGMNDLLGSCAVLSDARGQGDEQDTDEEFENESVEKTLPNDHEPAHESAQDLVQEHDADNEPCRKCGSSMVLRTISKGKHSGRKALVCETFPACRYAVLSQEVTS